MIAIARRIDWAALMPRILEMRSAGMSAKQISDRLRAEDGNAPRRHAIADRITAAKASGEFTNDPGYIRQPKAKAAPEEGKSDGRAKTVVCIYCQTEVPRKTSHQLICGSDECMAAVKRDWEARRRRARGVQPLSTKLCEYCEQPIERALPNQRVCSDLRCRRIMRRESKQKRVALAKQPKPPAPPVVVVKPVVPKPEPEPDRDPTPDERQQACAQVLEERFAAKRAQGKRRNRPVGPAPIDPTAFCRYLREHWRPKDRDIALALEIMQGVAVDLDED